MEGYDAKFDPPLDKRLECPICLLAQREPMQTPCGHRFCSTCILRALRETGPRCPVDNTRVSNSQLFKDNFAKREVLSLNVKCAAEDYGCTWHGELRNLEMHLKSCDLVNIECPNCCGYSCQRKALSPHLITCINKPEQCQHCSIHFTRNKLEEHLPHCSHITLPESLQSSLFKANEVLKWCGTIKLKVNSQCCHLFNQMPHSIFQVSGYLTAKANSLESFMYTGNWSSSLSVMPLNIPSAKIFWRMLHGPEVQAKNFGFGLFSSDTKSNLFCKVLKKNNDLSAVLGLHLKSGHSRTDLTIIYFYWSEPKRKLMACVAELKSHLVKQIQNRLHLLQQTSNRRGRATASSDAHISGRSQSHLQRSLRNGAERPPHPPHHHFPTVAAAQAQAPSAQPHQPNHIQHRHHLHPHIHPRHPAAAVALVTPGPHPHPSHTHQHIHPRTHHHHHLQQARSHPHTVLSSQLHQEQSGQSPIVHPQILSWQMSQSLNGYPWRMQTGNVPFFTFPSTPPSFLPANPYPYTFAPAPPFSINQIAQVPTTAVPVPSYAGIAVPQAAAVDSIVAGPGGTTFPVAAIPSLTEVPGEQLHNVPAVAVTLAGANSVSGQPTATAVVIQQPVMQPNQEPGGVQGSDMAVIHTIGHPPPPHAHYQPPQLTPHIAPTIITTDGGQTTGVIQNPAAPIGGERVAVGRYVALPSHLISVGTPQHNIVGVSLDHSNTSADATQMQVERRSRVMPNDYQQGSSSSESSSNSHFPSHVGPSDQVSGSSHNQITNDTRRALYNEGPGPSRNIDASSPSDVDSLDSNSPTRNFASIFYGNQQYSQFDNDISDDSSENPIDLESGDSEIFHHERGEMSDLSPESQLSSDPEESSSQSESEESDSPMDPSTLRLINNNTAIVVISPASDAVSPPISEQVSESLNSTFLSDETGQSDVTSDTEPLASADDSGPLSLPVLINISDSDSLNPQLETPASLINFTPSLSVSNSPNITSSSSSVLPSSSSNPSVHASSQDQPIVSTNSYSEMSHNAPVFLPVNTETEVDAEVEVPRILVRNQATRYFGASVSSQRQGQSSLMREAISSTSQNPDVHLINHQPVMQITQLHPHGHTPQLYTPQGHVTQLSGHMLHQQQPPSHLRNRTHHSRSHTTQPVYPNYPSHVTPGNVALEVTALPPPAAVVPMEHNQAMAHNSVHVLRWQQALGQQQQHQQHQQHAAISSHPPSAFSSHQGVEPVANAVHQQQQPLTGNFWETVMPSLDMSLQGGATESSHQ